MNSDSKGRYAELRVELRAAELGFIVSRPQTQARYDLILDDGEQLYRVQVKYAATKSTHASGSFPVFLQKKKGNEPYRRYKKSEVDLVIAYLPAVDSLVKLGPKLFDKKTAVTIRTEAPRNGQKRGVIFLEDVRW